jgi:outer membrane protein assembly factor BamB
VQKIIFAGLTLATALFCAAVRAADWPNWRGPDHNGISAEKGWLSQWPADGPKQLWKASVGTGFSSITVAGGRAYTMGNEADTDAIYCFDAVTGKPIWKYSYACPVDPHFYEGGPSATPTFDQDRVYTISKEGAIYCLDAANGKLVWSTNAAAATGAATPTWGFAGSALVQGGLLIFNIGDSGAALDKTTGSFVWTSGKGPAGYATAVPATFSNTPAVAMFSAQGASGVETKSGRKLWSYPFKTYSDMNIGELIVSGNDVFMSAIQHGAALVRVQDSTATQVWENKVISTHINSCIFLDGYLYGVDGPVMGPATLKCLEFATGNEKWSFKGLGGGALMLADRKIIMLGDKGELVVADASPQGFNPISRAQVLGGKCWTVPTLANGRIYCRNAKGDLVCLDVKGN